MYDKLENSILEKILKIIFDFSIKGNLATKELIRSIIELLVNYYEVDDYVSNIKISNFNSQMLASYNEDEKVIYINYQKIICSVASHISNNSNIVNFNHKILLINMYILEILLHELEHIIQIKKIATNNNEESNFLKISNNWEQRLKIINVKKYNMHLYKVNPLEREANLKSNKKLTILSEELNIKEINFFFNNEYFTTTLNDYNIANLIYPTTIFFKDFKKDSKFKETLQILNSHISLNRRLELGLQISRDEFEFVNEKLKAIKI